MRTVRHSPAPVIACLALLVAALASCTPKGDDSAASRANRPAATEQDSAEGSAPGAAPRSAVERGRYLTELGGCHDCHSPKVFTAAGPTLDTTRLLSGHRAGGTLPPVPAGALGPGRWGALASPELTAWAGPWGVSFASNLTPDPTGMQDWTAEHFIQTMRTGKHWGTGRAILPPMPWFNLKGLTDDDLRALFAYLQSLEPVANQVPPPVPPAAR